MFADADGYQAALRDVSDLTVLRPRDFRARLNWIEFSQLCLVQAYETSPRVAFISLPPDRVFVSFPTRRGSFLLAGGAVLPFGDILLHSAGENLHQRTTDACNWGYISLSQDSLKKFGWAVVNQDLAPPRRSRTLRLTPDDRQRLLRLHAQAGRLAEANLALVGHQEVLHGLEQDLILALISGLASGEPQPDRSTQHHKAAMMQQFEAMLAEHPHQRIRIGDICDRIGVSEASFRAACADLLGMSPGRYQNLRRLKSLRSALARVNPQTDDGIDIMKRYGVTDLHRFVTDYWKTYGELPPLPPQRDRPRGR